MLRPVQRLLLLTKHVFPKTDLESFGRLAFTAGIG